MKMKTLFPVITLHKEQGVFESKELVRKMAQ